MLNNVQERYKMISSSKDKSYRWFKLNALMKIMNDLAQKAVQLLAFEKNRMEGEELHFLCALRYLQG